MRADAIPVSPVSQERGLRETSCEPPQVDLHSHGFHETPGSRTQLPSPTHRTLRGLFSTPRLWVSKAEPA